jgi:hypothetical protein
VVTWSGYRKVCKGFSLRDALLLSSAAEQRAVNSKVPGSNPGGGAIGVVHTTPQNERGIKMDISDYCIVVVRNLAKVNVRVRFSLVALMV